MIVGSIREIERERVQDQHALRIQRKRTRIEQGNILTEKVVQERQRERTALRTTRVKHMLKQMKTFVWHKESNLDP